MHIGSRDHARNRCSVAIDLKMVFCTIFTAIRGVWAGIDPPKTARRLVESAAERFQSIMPRACIFCRQTSWIFSQTPACCQSRRRRQQVIPEPKPHSLGNISQAIPVRKTRRMPHSAARSEIRGRPPLGFGGSGGKWGSISFYNSSETRFDIAAPPWNYEDHRRNQNARQETFC
jgi:hypothetical protein